MALALQQVLRQTQRLIMTPQMQQSIQLLQMNSIELEQLTQSELLENPFLQVEEDRADGEAEPAAEAGAAETKSDEKSKASEGEDFMSAVEKDIERGAAEPPPSEAEPSETPTSEPASADASAAEGEATVSIAERPEQFAECDVNWEDFYEGAENRTYTREPETEQTDFSEYTAAKISLYEHLMRQLRLSSLEGVEIEVGEYLIGCLDEDGYLEPECIDEASQKFEMRPGDVEDVLGVIQELDPIGIGSRTSSECLLLQLHALGQYSRLAKAILENHFEALQRKKFKEIARGVQCEEEQVLELYNRVGRLEPKPGRAYSRESVQYITPDVYVKMIDGELSFILNEGNNGHLSINRLYRRLMRMQEKALTAEEKSYVTEKFRAALMLIKNIEKRKSTVLRVTEAIMEVQREFLDKGVEALKPLTLREVADMVGMHESTIARVTSKKYVETPQGLYRLKFFFSSAIESHNGAGGAVSSRSIKDKLAGMIEGEDPKKPLSDQKIAETLNREGFSIARRTVAKYREQLKILPAKLRRKA